MPKEFSSKRTRRWRSIKRRKIDERKREDADRQNKQSCWSEWLTLFAKVAHERTIKLQIKIFSSQLTFVLLRQSEAESLKNSGLNLLPVLSKVLIQELLNLTRIEDDEIIRDGIFFLWIKFFAVEPVKSRVSLKIPAVFFKPSLVQTWIMDFCIRP